MTYKQTLDFLYSQLPMYHRIGAAAYKADLNNTIAICKLLNNPHKKFKSVHVAGTNGKGSTSHMLAAILQVSGYKTGLYTSPHLLDFRERIRINGKMIPKKYVTEFIRKYQNDFKKIQPSFFEWTVGLAFDYFAKEKVDIAIIETGLGGRLDSTNVITPLLSVITNISLDHTNILGNTLKKIAVEKAGIIKRKVPVVIGESQTTDKIFIEKALSTNSEISFADKIYRADKISAKENKMRLNIYKDNKVHFKNLELDLTGNYQLKNILPILQSVELLKKKKLFIAEENIRKGLKQVKQLTGLQGRWQIIKKRPLTICDIGHNVDGIKYVLGELKEIPHQKLHIIIGMVNDKDVTSILKLFPTNAIYYFCKASVPRALDEKKLALSGKFFGLFGESFESVQQAYFAANGKVNENDVIFAGGSTFVVADLLRHLFKNY